MALSMSDQAYSSIKSTYTKLFSRKKFLGNCFCEFCLYYFPTNSFLKSQSTKICAFSNLPLIFFTKLKTNFLINVVQFFDDKSLRFLQNPWCSLFLLAANWIYFSNLVYFWPCKLNLQDLKRSLLLFSFLKTKKKTLHKASKQTLQDINFAFQKTTSILQIPHWVRLGAV